jgi:hypothetical protein
MMRMAPSFNVLVAETVATNDAATGYFSETARHAHHQPRKKALPDDKSLIMRP